MDLYTRMTCTPAEAAAVKAKLDAAGVAYIETPAGDHIIIEVDMREVPVS